MTVIKHIALPSKPSGFKKHHDFATAMPSRRHSDAAKQATYLGNARLHNRFDMANEEELQTKARVHFSHSLVCSVLSPRHAAIETKDTWYDQNDYNHFLADSRNTIKMVQHFLLVTGSLSCLDPAHHSITGLEHFLSPTIEKQRAKRCRQHVLDFLFEFQGKRKRRRPTTHDKESIVSRNPSPSKKSSRTVIS